MKKDTPRVAALTADLAIERERVRQYEERYNAQAREVAALRSENERLRGGRAKYSWEKAK